MWRSAWTQLQELEMHPFIPVFLPRKAQLVGAKEAWRNLWISVWSEFPFLWIFCSSSQRSGFCQEKRNTRKRENPPWVAKKIQTLFFGKDIENSFWNKSADIPSASLGYFCREWESPFQSGLGWISKMESVWKSFFWKSSAFLLFQVLFLALSGFAELITVCNWATWENAANPRRREAGKVQHLSLVPPGFSCIQTCFAPPVRC